MIKKFFDRFRKNRTDPKSLLLANFLQVKQLENAISTRKAAMTVILQLTGWSAEKANKVLGEVYFEELTNREITETEISSD